MVDLIIQPVSSSLQGELGVPADKSILHRAFLLAAVARGQSLIFARNAGLDNQALIKALHALGVSINQLDENLWSVEGCAQRGFEAPSSVLDLQNSGTGMRLLAGLLVGQPFASTLVGDASLSQRPMGRIVKPLSMMGACIQTSDQDTAPLHIKPVEKLQGIEYSLPVASAQVKSCILLAGLLAEGDTKVVELCKTRDHLEKMLSAFHYPIRQKGRSITIRGQHQLQACKLPIPSDISAAAFFVVAALLVPGSDITLQNVGINPTRSGVLDILIQMGAKIEIMNRRYFGFEPVADLRVHASNLQAIHLNALDVVGVIDELPIIMVAAACSQGVTRIEDAGELRYKECDRLHAMAVNLTKMGIQVKELKNGIEITGGQFKGGVCLDSFSDHRIAMAFAVAATVALEPVTIEESECIESSFMKFSTAAAQIGFLITEMDSITYE